MPSFIKTAHKTVAKKPVARSPKRKAKAPAAPARLSPLRAPGALSAEAWQAGLRQQFGAEQAFEMQRLGVDPVFSDFVIRNPASGGRYLVSIRGNAPGDNFCNCLNFATNDLGTCKHVEFTLSQLRARRGGKAALQRGFAPPYSEIGLHHSGLRRLRFLAGTECPPALARHAEAMLEAEGPADIESLMREAAQRGHGLRCRDEAKAFVAEARDAAQRRSVFDAAYPKGAKSPALLKLLKVKMYPYQAEGALFAAKAGRALIADDMGLGKTLQAIAAAELLSRHHGVERVLVICPTSLKHQWQREVARFTDRVAQVIEGTRAARQAQYAKTVDDVHHEAVDAAPIWARITNYETLARDLDLMAGWAPDLVIVDEAQRVKNWNTVAARALRRITSPYAIVLTGTPLQNRLEELIAIVQFVDQHRLGPTWRLLHEHQVRDDAGRTTGYRDLDRIGATLAPVMLRRRKSEVLSQLPARIDNTLFVPMTPQQLDLHAAHGDVVRRIVQRWRKSGYLSDADQRRLTCALQNMRMVCNSTYLLDPQTDHGSKVDEFMTLLDELLDSPDAKVVVFSQWLRTHELIERRLQTRGWDHVLFHGGVPSAARPALIDRFNDDVNCRIFLSTDAGGVGLNLQHAAAAVVNMDMPWNPAVLEQRIGRVHRMGQQRSVQVVNFVAQGSIEQGMLSVLAFKKSLFAGVLDGGESEVFMHGTRLSKFMETVDGVTSAMGAAVVEAEPAPVIVDAASQAEPQTEPPAIAAAPVAPDPWAPLIDAGLALIETLAQRNHSATPAAPNTHSPWIERDPQSGRDVLKLPLPEPQTMARIVDALGGLLAGLRRG